MNETLPTVTIGIAAYNEANNIHALLDALLQQDMSTFTLDSIRVVSDASDDDTDVIVKEYCPREGNAMTQLNSHTTNTTNTVELYRMPERSGVNQVQNILVEKNQSDILVVLDADIIPENAGFIASLIAPLIADANVALTSAELLPAQPKTFVEKVLVRNHLWKTQFFREEMRKNSVYSCYGPARAFSKDMMSMRYTSDVPVDAFSYFWSQKIGKRFVAVSQSRAIFRCPNNLADHYKQSRRFRAGRQSLENYFGDTAQEAYHLPKRDMFRALLREVIAHPVLFVSFLYISLCSSLQHLDSFQSKWEMAESSKKVL